MDAEWDHLVVRGDLRLEVEQRSAAFGQSDR
jgi:hypothetical protein